MERTAIRRYTLQAGRLRFDPSRLAKLNPGYALRTRSGSRAHPQTGLASQSGAIDLVGVHEGGSRSAGPVDLPVEDIEQGIAEIVAPKYSSKPRWKGLNFGMPWMGRIGIVAVQSVLVRAPMRHLVSGIALSRRTGCHFAATCATALPRTWTRNGDPGIRYEAQSGVRVCEGHLCTILDLPLNRTQALLNKDDAMR